MIFRQNKGIATELGSKYLKGQLDQITWRYV